MKRLCLGGQRQHFGIRKVLRLAILAFVVVGYYVGAYTRHNGRLTEGGA